MTQKQFISSEFSLAIQNYLTTKDQILSGSLPFAVIVIRTLIYIYGELDIINPYITKNEENLGGFDSNLTKYGFGKEDLQDFKKAFTVFVRTSQEINGTSLNFFKVEKYLIDMFFYKKKAMNLSDEEVINFKEYLSLSTNVNLKDYYDLYLNNTLKLDHYFASKWYRDKHDYNLIALKRNNLLLDAYYVLGYSKDQILNMKDEELENVNNQVYDFFKIPKDSPNKNGLLMQAVNYYKQFGNRLTSGNGYVDLLLLMSVLCTIVFILLLIAVKVF